MATAQEQGFRLDGKFAVVTGAGRGIGRACALALAGAGAEVVAMSRTESELAALVDEVAATGGACQATVCDVTDIDAVTAVFDALPRLDVLVNNAGGNQPQPFLEVETDVLDRLLDLNFRAAFLVAQAAARVMAKRGDGGVIVNMSSQMGHVGGPTRSVYCATKHALEGMTKAAAIELAPLGIRMVTVGPTFVETPLAQRFLADPDFEADVLDRIPLGRIGRAEEVANAVLFLASPAASLITGTHLLVDGGWTAR